MPYEKKWESGGLYHKFSGVVSAPEFLQAVQEVHGDRRFDALRYLIVDCLGVERFEVKVKTVMEAHLLNAMAIKTNPHVMLAIVTTDPLVSRLALLGQSVGLPSFETKLFPTVAGAREWLGHDDGV